MECLCVLFYVDLNECVELQPCDQICTNRFKTGYFCSCENGYYLEQNNHTCAGMVLMKPNVSKYTQTAVLAYNSSKVLAFLDVNECVAATCAGFCEEDEIGSYKCGCYAGYILHSDGRSCIGQSKNPFIAHSLKRLIMSRRVQILIFIE